VALNTFLDLHAFQSIPQKAGAQLPGISLHAVGARDSPSADRDAEAEGLLSQAAVEELEAPSTEEHGPEALPSGEADEVLAGVPSESCPESADECAVGKESVEAQDGGGWTNLIKLLCVVSIPTIWTYWARHRIT